MIIFASGRTDIPAFYSEWFINRIRAGFVDVRNPYVPQKVTRYRLEPKIVDCLVFCTKNPKPLIPYLDELKNLEKKKSAGDTIRFLLIQLTQWQLISANSKKCVKNFLLIPTVA